MSNVNVNYDIDPHLYVFIIRTGSIKFILFECFNNPSAYNTN